MSNVATIQNAERVPSTKQFIRSMFVEMINEVRTHDQLIVKAIEDSKDDMLTEEEIVEYMGEKIDGFFFGKDPDWWTVSL